MIIGRFSNTTTVISRYGGYTNGIKEVWRVDKKRSWQQQEFYDELENIWNWEGHYDPEHYIWENSPTSNKRNSYLMELGKEFGPISIPHRLRQSFRFR